MKLGSSRAHGGLLAARVGAAFTLHRSLLLDIRFGGELCVLGSLAVFTAGVSWSWLFARTRARASSWLSHALVDVAVSWAGRQILFAG